MGLHDQLGEINAEAPQPTYMNEPNRYITKDTYLLQGKLC